MIKYELHLDGIKQDPKQFNSAKAALDYIQLLKDAVFKNRNSRPGKYKKNMHFINSLEIVAIKLQHLNYVYSAVEVTSIGSSCLKSFQSKEHAEKYINDLNTTRYYTVIETKINES